MAAKGTPTCSSEGKEPTLLNQAFRTLSGNQLSDEPASAISLGPFSQRTFSESTAASANPASRTSSNFGGSLGRTISLTPAQMHLLATSRSNTLVAQATSLRSFSIDEAIDDVRIDEKSHDLLATLFNSSYDPPLPSTKCLQQFAKVVMRKIDPEVQARKDARLNYCIREKRQHDETLKQLREWAAFKDKMKTLKGVLTSIFTFCQRPIPPRPEKLIALAKYHYPPRGDLKVYVCDFGEGRFEKEEVALGCVEKCMSA